MHKMKFFLLLILLMLSSLSELQAAYFTSPSEDSFLDISLEEGLIAFCDQECEEKYSIFKQSCEAHFNTPLHRCLIGISKQVPKEVFLLIFGNLKLFFRDSLKKFDYQYLRRDPMEIWHLSPTGKISLLDIIIHKNASKYLQSISAILLKHNSVPGIYFEQNKSLIESFQKSHQEFVEHYIGKNFELFAAAISEGKRHFLYDSTANLDILQHHIHINGLIKSPGLKEEKDMQGDDKKRIIRKYEVKKEDLIFIMECHHIDSVRNYFLNKQEEKGKKTNKNNSKRNCSIM